jgi:hypothetical protein
MRNEQSGKFGGLTPQEAAQRSIEVRRQRKEERKQAGKEENERTALVTESDTEAVVAKLREKAKTGDVPAARELREWLDSGIMDKVAGHSKDQRLLRLLTAPQRACLAAALEHNKVSAELALEAWAE